MIDSLNRQASQLKEDLRAKEIEMDSHMKRKMDEERDKDY